MTTIPFKHPLSVQISFPLQYNPSWHNSLLGLLITISAFSSQLSIVHAILSSIFKLVCAQILLEQLSVVQNKLSLQSESVEHNIF